MASRHRNASPHESGKTGEEIRFATGLSILGWILVASGENGVVSIQIGEDPDQLAEGLQGRFPRAQVVRGGRDDERRLKRVVDFVEAPARGLDLPLDIRGTAFQQRVWQAVREIPVGQTRTYSDIASKIGAPKAIRAVGNACSTNHLALAIPCHRVLHKDGSPSGGSHQTSDRRRALIDREAEAVAREHPSPAPRKR